MANLWLPIENELATIAEDMRAMFPTIQGITHRAMGLTNTILGADRTAVEKIAFRQQLQVARTDVVYVAFANSVATARNRLTELHDKISGISALPGPESVKKDEVWILYHAAELSCNTRVSEFRVFNNIFDGLSRLIE